MGPSVKLAVVSDILPSSWSQQAVILHLLVRNLDTLDYCLICSSDYEGNDP